MIVMMISHSTQQTPNTNEIFWIKIVFFTFFAISIVVIISLDLFNRREIQLENKIYPHVYVGNKNFGEKTKKEVIAYYDQKNKQLALSKVEIAVNQRKVATFSARQLKLGYDSQGLAERAYLIGRTSKITARIHQKINTVFGLKKYKIIAQRSYKKEPLENFLDLAADNYEKPAENALFTFKNNRVTNFKKEKKGFAIDRESFFKEVDKQLMSFNNRPRTTVINLKIKTINPEITLAEINKFGIEELIGKGQSNFSHSIRTRINNIILAASKFNGVLIPKGKVLSFNQTVGDISSLTGFQPAYIIKGGRTVLGDGGGVCQVSTTLFRAALNSGLPIIERHAHAYRVSYYENDSPPGFDATVFAPRVDLKIKNNTPAYILIRTEVDKKSKVLSFYFYGKKDNRQIKISQSTVSSIAPPPAPLYQEDPNLPPKAIRQIDFAASGAKVFFNYQVSKNGQVIFSKKFRSNYRPWRAIYLVGPGSRFLQN